MAYNYEWPYFEPGRFNLDALYNDVKELYKRLDGIVEEAVKLSNEYTDAQLSNYQEQVDELREELNQTVIDLQNQYENFTEVVNARLVFISQRIDNLEDALVASIAAVNARTDLAIEQNNEYIFSHLEESLARITVLNYFTGTRYTVQDMFDYLAMLHVENGITYDELAAAEITYTDLANYHMTYTQLAVNGGAIIQ